MKFLHRIFIALGCFVVLPACAKPEEAKLSEECRAYLFGAQARSTSHEALKEILPVEQSVDFPVVDGKTGVVLAEPMAGGFFTYQWLYAPVKSPAQVQSGSRKITFEVKPRVECGDERKLSAGKSGVTGCLPGKCSVTVTYVARRVENIVIAVKYDPRDGTPANAGGQAACWMSGMAVAYGYPQVWFDETLDQSFEIHDSSYYATWFVKPNSTFAKCHIEMKGN